MRFKLFDSLVLQKQSVKQAKKPVSKKKKKKLETLKKSH